MNKAAERAPEGPAERLAEAFAQHVERWGERLKRDQASLETVRQAAYQTSLATSSGHVCVSLADLFAASSSSSQVGVLRDSLLASGLVGTGTNPGAMPLIVDGEDRLYLHRYFDYECRLARRLVRAARMPPRPGDASARGRLDALFPATGEQTESVDWQKLAAALALRQGLTIISGGPGTGKTTTVVNLLACLVTQEPDCRIALAAPTGKAAARMTEAIRQRTGHLPPALREKLPDEASTIHRLLGWRPGPDRFVHHAGNPLAIDALVLDEASMLDLALATRLLEAVPDNARIILLGDKDQLAAVESGAVFAELCSDPSLSEPCRRDLAAMCSVPVEAIVPPEPAQPGALRDAAVWLDRNYRFAVGSGIARLAADIKLGRAVEITAWLRAGGDRSVQWLESASDQPNQSAIAAAIAGYAAYLETVRNDPSDVDGISRAFGRFRALCAVREGSLGVVAVNEQVTRHARQTIASVIDAQAYDGRSAWYPGRPVMVLRNDYVLKLFNGDVGITLPDATGRLMVYFADGGGYHPVAPARLPDHETAFAMTVHKAQGSEFDQVLVMLPSQPSRVVSRELLYTAVTRAKASVTLCAGADMLAVAIEARSWRHSGLLARLKEAAMQPHKE